MSILVTGGAGYIGSHVTRLLQQRGEKVVIVDNFSSGIKERIGDAEPLTFDLAAGDATAKLASADRKSVV